MDQQRLVFVVIDGMADTVAERMLGYMEGLVEQQIALRAHVQSTLPSLSRPCYETIFTGSNPHVHGVTANEVVRRSNQESLFDIVRSHGLVSAVSAYYWVSELYHEAPFHRVLHREQTDNDHGFQHGRFYFEDAYPDSHVYVDAEVMRVRHQPHLLVIHPMGVDDAGHKHGVDSREYHGQVLLNDVVLANLVPGWLEAGYQVVVTADHGMDELGYHGGTPSIMRRTPLYVISPRLKLTGRVQDVMPQPMIAHFLCELLGLQKGPGMRELPQSLIENWFTTNRTDGGSNA